MNILNKLLLLLSLSMTPAVTVSAQAVNEDFDTFQTAEEYLADFSYLREYDYRLSYADYYDPEYGVDYSGEPYLYYAFPIYYNVIVWYNDNYMKLYYTNDKYQFYYFYDSAVELVIDIYVDTYTGNEVEMPFLALNYLGMNQVIEHDQEIESNSISIYNSFYNFFTGFFPNEVVTEYHGIFTFIVVGFLLFLVFGFVFFLFRVIRRLVGFK